MPKKRARKGETNPMETPRHERGESMREMTAEYGPRKAKAKAKARRR
jgi:hypothetical protein